MMNKVLFGIDIGGTTVKCGLFTLNGELLEKSEIPTDKQDNGSRILSMRFTKFSNWASR